MSFIQSVGRRLGLAAVTLSLALGLVCFAAPAANAETQNVEMTSALQFSPREIKAAPGDTIVWNNAAGLPHNVVFDDGSKFDADEMKTLGKMLGKGQTQITLPADLPAGDYTYYCAPHRGAGMNGVISVQ
ncbi:MAG: plastocyanin/azurin family copper-binding protein [Cyanobacteria bacterium P01_C01_bin.89]|mgnify:FL=1